MKDCSNCGHCARDQTVPTSEALCPPPLQTRAFYLYFLYFLFCIFFCYFFALFCVDMGNFFNFFI